MKNVNVGWGLSPIFPVIIIMAIISFIVASICTRKNISVDRILQSPNWDIIMPSEKIIQLSDNEHPFFVFVGKSTHVTIVALDILKNTFLQGYIENLSDKDVDLRFEYNTANITIDAVALLRKGDVTVVTIEVNESGVEKLDELIRIIDISQNSCCCEMHLMSSANDDMDMKVGKHVKATGDRDCEGQTLVKRSK